MSRQLRVARPDLRGWCPQGRGGSSPPPTRHLTCKNAWPCGPGGSFGLVAVAPRCLLRFIAARFRLSRVAGVVQRDGAELAPLDARLRATGEQLPQILEPALSTLQSGDGLTCVRCLEVGAAHVAVGAAHSALCTTVRVASLWVPAMTAKDLGCDDHDGASLCKLCCLQYALPTPRGSAANRSCNRCRENALCHYGITRPAAERRRSIDSLGAAFSGWRPWHEGDMTPAPYAGWTAAAWGDAARAWRFWSRLARNITTIAIPIPAKVKKMRRP